MWGIQVCEAKNPRIPCARDIGLKPPQALKSPVSHKGHRAFCFDEVKQPNTVPKANGNDHGDRAHTDMARSTSGEVASLSSWLGWVRIPHGSLQFIGM